MIWISPLIAVAFAVYFMGELYDKDPKAFKELFMPWTQKRFLEGSNSGRGTSTDEPITTLTEDGSGLVPNLDSTMVLLIRSLKNDLFLGTLVILTVMFLKSITV